MDDEIAKECLASFQEAAKELPKKRGRKPGCKRSVEEIAKMKETRRRNKLAKQEEGKILTVLA